MRKIQETVSQNVLFPSDDFKIIISENTTRNQEKAFHEAIEIKVFVEGRSMVMIDSDVIIAEAGDISSPTIPLTTATAGAAPLAMLCRWRCPVWRY